MTVRHSNSNSRAAAKQPSRPPLLDGLRALQSSFATMTAVAALLAPMRPALAGPTGGTVVEGSAAISQTGAVTNIDQSTHRAIINWQTFSIGLGETVNFHQPSSLSVTLNRVIGNEQSVIAGALNANGRVFLVNSAGILFTRDAQVNVGGLVASTLDISNKDFMAGNYVFSGSSTASVVNRGNIDASAGGYVALLGKTVSNEGVISATLGSAALASGEKVTLNFNGDSLVDVTIDKGTLNALVENKGAIKADGGQVILTAKAADAVLSAQVNNSGVIQARTIADLTGGSTSSGKVRVGKIKLLASGGTTKVAGRLDASAPDGGKGGTIDTSGNKVTVADSAVITTASATGENGSWIIDPDGFAIAASGGDITGAALSSQLGSNNVTIYSTSGGGSSGNIDVTDPVSWAANTTLTLNATNAINVNAPITGTGANSGLTLNAGGDINVNAPQSVNVNTLIAAAGGNVYINAAQNWATAGAWTFTGGNISINDALGWSAGALTLNASKNIYVNAVMSATGSGSLVATYGSGTNSDLSPMGLYTAFGLDSDGVPNGTFAGRIDFNSGGTLSLGGHAYTLITSWDQLVAINNSTGYFALAADLAAPSALTSTAIPFFYGSLEGLGHVITGLTITGGNFMDQLGSRSVAPPTSSIRDLGLVNVNINNTKTHAAGLVDTNNGGTIGNSFVTGAVSGGGSNGGLVGINYYGGVISNSYFVGAVTSTGSNVGGLVGFNSGSTIVNSSANAAVTGGSTGTSGSGYVGGLVGWNTDYRTLATNGTSNRNAIGTLNIGYIYNSHSSGTVDQRVNYILNAGLRNVRYIGGLVGYNEGDIDNSYSTTTVNVSDGAASVGGLVGYNAVYSSGGKTHRGTVSNSFETGDVYLYYEAREQNADGIGALYGTNAGDMTPNDKSWGNVIIVTANGARVDNIGGRNTGNSDAQNFGSITLDGIVVTPSASNSAQGAQAALQAATAREAANQQSTQASAQRNAAQQATAQAASQQTAAASAAAAAASAAAAARQTAAAQLAATRQAATGAANVIANAAPTSSATSANLSVSAAGRQAIGAMESARIDENIEVEEPAQTAVPAARPRARHAAAASASRRAHPRSRDAGYGASIRSIEVDGQKFDLGDDGKTNPPEQKAR